MKIARGQKGFTLIELAIVLVIIGIIIGAVLKGQDLIQSARSKKFISDTGGKWELATWTFFDRKGRFPGDTNRNGKIGDTSVKTDFTAADFINPPEHPVTFGSFTFYVFLGTDAGSDTGKNILVICKAANCGTAFTKDELDYIEALDTSIDGVSDGATGLVRGVGASPAITATTDTWVAYTASAPPGAAWTADTTKALVYYFDRKP